jgi:sugar/nucleoside kinase (ribokinase family)
METPALLVVGGASLDVLHFAGRAERSAGGAGLYTALAALRAGARVTMLAPRPEPMPEALAPAADRVVWIGPRVPPAELPQFEIVHDGEGRATMRRAVWGAEARLTSADLPPGELPEWSYCVPFFEPGKQIDFLSALRARGRRTAAGTYRQAAEREPQRVREVTALADVFFCNESEAKALFGSLDAARTEPGRLLFVTRGKRGARVVQGAHSTDVPGVAVRELDPTGAGDTFCGTTLARLGLGDHPVRAAERGVRAAAETVTAVGPAALLEPGPLAPEPGDPRVRVDEERVAGVARLLAALPEARPFDFVGEDFPEPGDPRALDFFFAATLQQFGFWDADEAGGYARPFVAEIGGKVKKGSDYLWAGYRRWLRDAPDGLTAIGQERLDREELARRLDADGRALPAADLRLAAARAYGGDMRAIGSTPAGVVERALASPTPLRSLLTQLDHVGGYKEDPLRKKSALLAMILRERPERWLSASGDEELPPIVDYHVQRACLRLGLVTVDDDALRRRLEARRAVTPDGERAVRDAAFRAVAELQRRSGRTMAVCDRFLFEMRTRCPETSEPECARCPADAACAHRTELFQPVLRTAFY